MSNLTDVFKENLEINKLRKDDPRVKNARIFGRRGYRDNI
jgi:hypothetical protein